MAQRLGVKDVADIKFAENRVNGQSRGLVELVCIFVTKCHE